jgi:tetratricopeptide (TPR) repeat protein
MADFGVAHIDEIEEKTDGRCPYRPVRLHFDIETFGATTWTAKAAGDRLLNEHDESEDDGGDELYYVISGHATFEIGGAEHDAPTGTFVHVAPGVMRTAFAKEAGTTIFAVGGAPAGKVYEPHNWETWSPLYALFHQERYDEMLEQARPLLQPKPNNGPLYYNVACAESLAGRHDDALEHLRTGLQLRPGLVDLVREDSDFDAIRDRPEFAELIAEGS